jgi:hypothetical protein
MRSGLDDQSVETRISSPDELEELAAHARLPELVDVLGNAGDTLFMRL